MVPLHPKFRRLLLNDRKLISMGFSDKIIQTWDQNIIRLFYLKKYCQKPSAPILNDLSDEIDQLVSKFKPQFKLIHQKWIASQKKNIKLSYFALSPGKLFINSFIIFWLWLAKLYYAGKDIIIRKRTDATIQ